MTDNLTDTISRFAKSFLSLILERTEFREGNYFPTYFFQPTLILASYFVDNVA